MPKFGHHRWQQPVGQGLFHSGQVSLEDISFEYVYDCGSDSLPGKDLEKLIRRYHRQISSEKPIDFLFISHFDRDHVNGLRFLLDRSLPSVDTVFLPYLSPVGRLFMAGRADDRGDVIDPDYVSFLANPAAYFLDRGTRRVIYIYGDTDEGGGPVEPAGIGPEGPDTLRKERPRVERDRKLCLIPKIDATPKPPDGHSVPRSDIVSSSVEFMAHSSPVYLLSPDALTAEWLFVTYADPDWRGADKLQACLRNHLGNTLVDKINSGEANLERILANKKELKELKSAYRDAGKINPNQDGGKSNTNGGSLCLFSGPYAEHDIYWSDNLASYQRLETYVVSQRRTDRVAWLGTGDAEIGDADPRARDRFAGFFQKYRPRHSQTRYRSLLDEVSTYCLPHHGSLKNFSIDLVRQVNPSLCTIPAGWQSKHGHPDNAVLQKLFDEGIPYAWIHENSGVGLGEHFGWHLP